MVAGTALQSALLWRFVGVIHAVIVLMPR
jgi:hypothetical protein